ncbi:MAG: hypothetical protein ABIG20_02065 [archaeon]
MANPLKRKKEEESTAFASPFEGNPPFGDTPNASPFEEEPSDNTPVMAKSAPMDMPGYKGPQPKDPLDEIFPPMYPQNQGGDAEYHQQVKAEVGHGGDNFLENDYGAAEQGEYNEELPSEPDPFQVQGESEYDAPPQEYAPEAEMNPAPEEMPPMPEQEYAPAPDFEPKLEELEHKLDELAESQEKIKLSLTSLADNLNLDDITSELDEIKSTVEALNSLMNTALPALITELRAMAPKKV